MGPVDFPKNRKELNKIIDYARLAGFLEGEGCIRGFSRQGADKFCHSLRVSASQVYRKGHHHNFLDLLKKYFGGEIYKKKRLTKGGKTVSSYVAHGVVAANLLDYLFPYLEEKKDRAKIGIKLGKIALKSNGYMKDSRTFEKEKLAKEIKRLNHIK